MQEPLVALVVEILAVVGTIEQGGAGVSRCECAYHLGDYMVGVDYGIVIGVAYLVDMPRVYGDVVIGKECGVTARITLMIAEMRSVGV